jgi:hypothetical protein
MGVHRTREKKAIKKGEAARAKVTTTTVTPP